MLYWALGLQGSVLRRRFYSRQLRSEFVYLSSHHLGCCFLTICSFLWLHCSILHPRNNSSPALLPKMHDLSSSHPNHNALSLRRIAQPRSPNHTLSLLIHRIQYDTANAGAHFIDLIRLEFFPDARSGSLFPTTIIPFSTLSRFAQVIPFRARHTNGHSPS